MTLSISDQPTSWHRILPKPAALTSGSIFGPNLRRISSISQHHIVLDRPSSRTQEDNGRRNTSPGLTYQERYPRNSVIQADVSDSGIRRPAKTTYNQDLKDQSSDSSAMQDDCASRSPSPSNASQTEASSSQFCLCQPDPKIPRPRNAFILYRQHQQAAVVAQNPGLPNPDISKIIGEQWRSLPIEAKNEWKALAEEEKARHQQQYPDYRYQPRRNGRYSVQSSTSGLPTPAIANLQANCHKCGGKTMNPPSTPYAAAFMPVLSEIPTMIRVPVQARGTPNTTVSQYQKQPLPFALASPPHSGRQRAHDQVFGPSTPNDPRLRYIGHPVQMDVDSRDSKRRRFNTNGIYIPTREIFPEHMHQTSPKNTGIISTGRTAIAQPGRTYYTTPTSTAPPQLIRQMQPSHFDQKRDTNLTLPPLKTDATSARPEQQAQPLRNQNQKSGIEAMIMSIPVLHKIRILSQISPYLASPSVASPQPEVRGAIIAIEGMDPTSVYNMTNSLAEQMEKDGKFAVRIFGGPNPYENVNNGQGLINTTEMRSKNPEEFLKMIGVWHKISKEMIEYITTKPVISHNLSTMVQKSMHKVNSNIVDETSSGISFHPSRKVIKHTLPSNNNLNIDTNPSQTLSHSRPNYSNQIESIEIEDEEESTDSAISPKTITSKAKDMSLKTPPRVQAKNASKNPNADSTMQQKQLQYPRIPASALLNSQSRVPSPPLPTPPAVLPSKKHHTMPMSSPIPIALVPMYQPTTVNASSVSIPITDAYSPTAHWQWLATLWRGCVGPDVTVVIRGVDDPDEDLNSASNPNPNPNTVVEPGVEIRLSDHRSIIVRSHTVKYSSPSSTTEMGNGLFEEKRKESLMRFNQDENWEKAKRRVGFEVEEFLRK